MARGAHNGRCCRCCCCCRSSFFRRLLLLLLITISIILRVSFFFSFFFFVFVPLLRPTRAAGARPSGLWGLKPARWPTMIARWLVVAAALSAGHLRQRGMPHLAGLRGSIHLDPNGSAAMRSVVVAVVVVVVVAVVDVGTVVLVLLLVVAGRFSRMGGGCVVSWASEAWLCT